jgi:alkylhydroperoxidase/carboxymuconolactone decarboxylase family protein YurZ
MVGYEKRLRRLAIHEERSVGSVLGAISDDPMSPLTPRELGLVRLAALVAVNGPATTVEWATSRATAAGATPDDLVAVLEAVAPVIGSAAVVSATPKLALALGYDLDADLEVLANDRSRD